MYLLFRRQKEQVEEDKERRKEERIRKREQKLREREERRNLKKVRRQQEEEQKKLQMKIAMEERRLLLAQRNLESIRLIAELLARAKVHRDTRYTSQWGDMHIHGGDWLRVVLQSEDRQFNPRLRPCRRVLGQDT